MTARRTRRNWTKAGWLGLTNSFLGVRTVRALLMTGLLLAGAAAKADFVLTGSQHLDVITSHTKGELFDASTAVVLAEGYIGDAYVNDTAFLDVRRPSGNAVGTALACNAGRIAVASGGVSTLRAYGTSSVDISGGGIAYLYARDSSGMAMSGGVIGYIAAAGQIVKGGLWAEQTSRVNVSGGIIYALGASGTSNVNVSGGSIGYYDPLGQGILGGLWAEQTSRVNVSGGIIYALGTSGTSNVAVSGGTIYPLGAYGTSNVAVSGGIIGSLDAFDTSNVAVSGGIIYALGAYGTSNVAVSGGTIYALSAGGTSRVTILGYDVEATDGLILDGDRVLGTGILTGRWLDGTAWTIPISYHGIDAVITAGLGPTRYVDQKAAPGGNGWTWSRAFTDLQDALAAAAASNGEIEQVWVAAGTYRPDHGSGNRTASFRLLNGVAIYGGFAGTETDLAQRDPTTHVTILSGDLSGNDAGAGSPEDLATEPTRGDNSYHVVTAEGLDATAVLDGFVIEGGQADASYPYNAGGGLFKSEGTATVGQCTFRGNCGAYGGAVYNSGGSLRLADCTFTCNGASASGGGLYNVSSAPVLTGCAFRNNSSPAGGAMRNLVSDAQLLRCSVQANSAVYGGGIYNDASEPMLADCVLSGNQATGSGGALYCYGSAFPYDSVPVLINCTLYGNAAGDLGGGMRNQNSCPVVANCILWANTDSGGQTSTAQIYGPAIPHYSCIQGGAAGDGNIATDPQFGNALGPDGVVGTGDDDLRLRLGSPCLDAGDNTVLPADAQDLDGDGDSAEPLPMDIVGCPRFSDVPGIPDTGNGTPPIVDMGAHETSLFLTAEPEDRHGCAGDALVLEVTATGLEPLSYRWYRNGVALVDGSGIQGAATATLRIDPAIGPQHAGSYHVVVSSGCDFLASRTAVVTVTAPPRVMVHPTGQTVCTGETVVLQVQAGGTDPSYQWIKDGTPLADGDRISGTATATLAIQPVHVEDAGTYRVEVSNSCGTVLSNAAVLQVNEPPTITVGPASQTVRVNSFVTLSVEARGTEPLTYRWYKDGTPLADGGRIIGATWATLTINPVRREDAGQYTVVITNVCGSTTSAPATLRVLLAGDVDADGDVDVFDIIGTVIAFGSKPGDPHWHPGADFDGNGIVDVFDVIAAIGNFGLSI